LNEQFIGEAAGVDRTGCGSGIQHRGKLDADDVRAICEGLRIAMDTLRMIQAKPCADCGGAIGQDSGPADGWQLEDGRTVCQRCCVIDTRQQLQNR